MQQTLSSLSLSLSLLLVVALLSTEAIPYDTMQHTAWHPLSGPMAATFDAISRSQNPENCSTVRHFRLRHLTQGLTNILKSAAYALAAAWYQGAVLHFGPKNSDYPNPLSCPDRSFQCYFQPLTYCPPPDDAQICSFDAPIDHWNLFLKFRKMVNQSSSSVVTDFQAIMSGLEHYVFRPNSHLEARIRFHKNKLELPDRYIGVHIRTSKLTAGEGSPRLLAATDAIAASALQQAREHSCSAVFVASDTAAKHTELRTSIHAVNASIRVLWVAPEYTAASMHPSVDIMDTQMKRWYNEPREFDEGLEFLAILFTLVDASSLVVGGSGGPSSFISNMRWRTPGGINATFLAAGGANWRMEVPGTSICTKEGTLPIWPTQAPWKIRGCKPGTPGRQAACNIDGITW